MIIAEKSKKNYKLSAATHIQKIVRGHQVRNKKDTNPRTISDCLSLIMQTITALL